MDVYVDQVVGTRVGPGKVKYAIFIYGSGTPSSLSHNQILEISPSRCRTSLDCAYICLSSLIQTHNCKTKCSNLRRGEKPNGHLIAPNLHIQYSTAYEQLYYIDGNLKLILNQFLPPVFLPCCQEVHHDLSLFCSCLVADGICGRTMMAPAEVAAVSVGSHADFSDLNGN